MKLSYAARLICSPKSFARWFGLGAALCFAGTAAAQDQFKVAVVDVSKIFGSYYKTKELAAKVNAANDAYKQELDTRMEGHHRLLEEIARLDKDLEKPDLNATSRTDLSKQRDTKLADTRKLERDITEFKTGRERSLQELTLRVRTQIVEDIMVVVNERVESKHYTLVLNRSGRGAAGRTFVLQANDALDITDDLLATLNKDHPVTAKTPLDPTETEN